MVTIFYGILLCISVSVLMYMAQKNYSNIDISYWTILVIVPIIILGYWLKTRIKTQEAAIILFSFIYLDSTVLLIVTLFSILRFIGVKVESWLKILGYSLTFGHLFVVWACIDNRLYYRSIKLIDTGYGMATKMTSGPLKVVHVIYLLIIMSSIVGVIITAIIKNGTYSRRTMTIYTAFISVGLIIYAVEMFCDVDFSVLPFLYTLADISIAIEYDRVHTHDITFLIAEKQGNHETKGYAAFDLNGRFLSCNERMLNFFPDLAFQVIDDHLKEKSAEASVFYKLIKEYREKKNTHLTFNSGNMVCQCELSEFSIKKDGKIHGFLFDIRDVTEEQKVIDVMKDYNETLNAEIDKKTENIRNIQEKVVLGLANMVENRDNNTGGHIKRTSDVVKILVNEIKESGAFDIDEQLAMDIVRAAPMHDIGKITIENNILLKPSKLTNEEYAIMKTHSTKSAEFVNIILKDVEEKHFVNVAYNVAKYHHERWDGRGYPEGLVGKMIPLEARIMAVADVYDALLSSRSYKKPMSYEEASKIMIEGMGSQFDPNMLTVFLGCREKLESYYSDNNNIKLVV